MTFWDPLTLQHFLSLLGRLSLCWLDGGRRVRRGGGDPLFTLTWCLGWSTNKSGLRVGCLLLSLGSGKSRYEMEDTDEGKGCCM